MILATDLDRTLLPNGLDPNDGAEDILFELLRDKGIPIVYVSGRNLALLNEAIDTYDIPVPDFFVGDVGSAVYKKEVGRSLMPYEPWFRHIADTNPHWDNARMRKLLIQISGLVLQEEWKLNEYKISFYLRDTARKDEVLARVRDVLTSTDVDAEIIWSVDQLKDDVGLIDVLPRNATKRTAILFLLKDLGYSPEAVVYAGDSGNDLLLFEDFPHTVLVANAIPEVRAEVERINAEVRAGKPPVYCARGILGMNGNYASGIIEGLVHFGVLSEEEVQRALESK